MRKKAKSHTIAEHSGILQIEPEQAGSKVKITFDPARLTETEIRRIVLEHIRPGEGGLQKCALRLDGSACEAAAAKLERRVERVPGVRRATATYIGRALCLTFDSGVTSESDVLEGVRAAGARVSPLKTRAKGVQPGLWRQIRSGDLNDELSCAIGLVCLLASFLIDRMLGRGMIANALYMGAYIFCGQAGVRSALASLREWTLDVDVLMVLAAIGAAIVGSPFEGALLLFLFSFSNVLQRHALERTQRAIESLLTLRPNEAVRKRNGRLETVGVEDLMPGDIVVVRPGELLPIDGVVAEGHSSLDESSLTGESMPVAKSVGAAVFAGTLNQAGALEIAVTKKAEDSTLARMVKLVAEAQAEKSGTQRFLEKTEQSYAVGVIGFTALVFLARWIAWHEPFDTAFYRAMTVMVVASPCALVISTPATVLSAIGGAARRGILVKGGAHLEQAARVTTVAFDKTGTLTAGRPSVTDILLSTGAVPLADVAFSHEATRLLTACAALESKSEHPLAAAIVTAAKEHRLVLPDASDFQATAGKGAEAIVGATRWVVGSARLFVELNAESREAFLASSEAMQSRGRTCVWLGERKGAVIVTRAVFALADTLRPGAREAIAKLRTYGIRKVVMLTGDQTPVARAVAADAGVDDFHAELLPEEKVLAIRELKRDGVVLMVGDGVNDAPALATAHLGAAMGAAGTDIAMETADVVLMGESVDGISHLIGMARAAHRVLKQNLIFSGAVIIVLVAAALGFDLPLPLGVVGHEGSTVLVCLNGLRLLAYR